MRLSIKKPAIVIACITICFLAGWIGSVYTSSSITTWYQQLNKPSFQPPSWLFGPVWTILYILMGISLYLIIKDGIKTTKKKQAVMLFVLQLVLNTAWSIIFFGLQLPSLALFEMIILWITIIMTYNQFKKISNLASQLLIPYILWVTFAIVLNASIVILN